MAMIPGLETKANTPGKKKYDQRPPENAFPGMSETEKLQMICHNVSMEDRTQRFRRDQTWYLNGLYYLGYQNLDLNLTTGQIDIYERDDYFIENQFRKHVDTVKQMLSQLEGDIIARPGSDNPASIATARVADGVLSSMRDNVGYEKIRDQKNLYKALFGNAFLFADYVVDKKYGTVVSPKYNYEEQPGPPDEMGNPVNILAKIPTGFEKRYKGSEVAIACSPLEIRVRADIKGGLDAVPWLRWDSRQDIDVLRYVYPNLDVTGSDTAIGDGVELNQNYIELLAHLPGNTLGDSPIYNRSPLVQRARMSRTWLQPCTFKGDKALMDKFPDGVHVITVNDRVVDYYPENLLDRWTHEVLIPSPHSLLGDGLYDFIPMQDQINEMNSLFIQHLRYSTTGKNFYDPTVIDSRDIVNDPKNNWVPVRPKFEQNVASAVHQMMPAALSQDVTAWISHVHEMGQDMTSAYDPATGKGLGANTPYSQSVFLNEKAQSRWKTSNGYNKPEVIRFHRTLLQIARENWIDPRKRSFQTQTGEWSFEQFTQADLQGEVDLILTDGDIKPKSRAEQIQALTMWVQIAPLLPMLPPKQKLRIEEVLGLPPDSNPQSTQISRAYRHIDRLTKGEEYSPLPLVDDAQAQVPVFQDFLASEQGEALAEENPQVFANIYSFMTTLLMIGMMHQASPVPQVLGQQGQPSQQSAVPGKPGQRPGTPPAAPGGQPGQQGGGPGSATQPTAQSPAQPAPPVAPPSA